MLSHQVLQVGQDEGSSDYRRAIAFIGRGSEPDSAEWLRYLMEN